MNKYFYILNGNNGATYVCNTKNWKSICISLNFYKARSLKAVFLKQGFKYFLFVIGTILKLKIKSSNYINQYLQNVCKSNVDFNINKNCSILISPTRDKVIVNNHEESFQKFAFGESSKNVKKESVIYNLLEKPVHFSVSKLSGFVEKNNFCSFKLHNKKSDKKKLIFPELNFVPILVEFFKASKIEKVTFAFYLESLTKRLNNLSDAKFSKQLEFIKTHNTKYGDEVIYLGLVHRDFKPWNTANHDKLLIYDFEESIINGPPLEDLFNYYIDPIIRYDSSIEVSKVIFTANRINLYVSYLKELSILLPFEILLQTYLIERIIFWNNFNDISTSERYLELSNHLLLKKTK